MCYSRKKPFNGLLMFAVYIALRVYNKPLKENLSKVSGSITECSRDRADEDDVGVVDFPQHLLNASLRTSRSVHEHVIVPYQEHNTFGNIINNLIFLISVSHFSI